MKCRKVLSTVALLSASSLFTLGGANAQSADLPDGPGKAAVLENCSACHALELITSKRRSSDEWAQIVNRMISNGAPMSEDQYKEVVAYLGTHLGTAPAADAKANSSGVASNSPSAAAPAAAEVKRKSR
jgi:mono/diheme cytochrome c family protein